MPIIKSAKKKQKQDIKKTKVNEKYIKAYRSTLKIFFKKKTGKKIDLKKVYSVIDRAVKKNIIHKNKASRLKSRAAKFIKK